MDSHDELLNLWRQSTDDCFNERICEAEFQTLVQAFSRNLEVVAVVTKVLARGLMARIGPCRVFLPEQHIEIGPPSALESYVGQMLRVRVIWCNFWDRFVVVSRRVILEEALDKVKNFSQIQTEKDMESTS